MTTLDRVPGKALRMAATTGCPAALARRAARAASAASRRVGAPPSAATETPQRAPVQSWSFWPRRWARSARASAAGGEFDAPGRVSDEAQPGLERRRAAAGRGWPGSAPAHPRRRQRARGGRGARSAAGGRPPGRRRCRRGGGGRAPARRRQGPRPGGWPGLPAEGRAGPHGPGAPPPVGRRGGARGRTGPAWMRPGHPRRRRACRERRDGR